MWILNDYIIKFEILFEISCSFVVKLKLFIYDGCKFFDYIIIFFIRFFILIFYCWIFDFRIY